MSLEVETSEAPLPVYVLGVRVDPISQQQTLDTIEDMVKRYQASNGQISCQQVITVNVEFVMMAQRNRTFRETINQAALVVADGMGIVLATRYLGRPVPERVTGTDTLAALAQRCAANQHSLYLLGAAPGVAEEAGRRLQELAPGLRIAGTYAGSPAPDEEEAIIERIKEAQPAILCVAYGAPNQELWISRNLHRLPVAVAMGVGGAYDFLSGRQRRAPRWMQRAALEWVYRLYREPWRWRRMLAIPRFMLQVLLKGRKSV